MTYEELRVFNRVVAALTNHQEMTRPIQETQDALAEAAQFQLADDGNFMEGYSKSDLLANEGFGSQC